MRKHTLASGDELRIERRDDRIFVERRGSQTYRVSISRELYVAHSANIQRLNQVIFGHFVDSAVEGLQVIRKLRDGDASPVSDDKNPAFIFQTIDTDILRQIESGEINATHLAIAELRSRGIR